MNDADRRYLAAATAEIEALLRAKPGDALRPHGLSPELQAFAEPLDRLLTQLSALRRLTLALARGDLSHASPPRSHLLDPLKQLQSNLRHLTWQAQQIADGDLDQQVDFLGDFSEAFNRVIQGLREKRIAEDNLLYLSLHDALTGVYNRTYFNEEIERLRGSPLRPISFVFADVDNLKDVNDTLGHQAGDLLIQKAARVIEHGVRAEDVVVRIGGDEFAVILYNGDQSAATTVISRIRDALRDYNRGDREIPLSLSLGAGTATSHQGLERALREADQAMYRDKLMRKQCAQSGPAPCRRVDDGGAEMVGAPGDKVMPR